MRSLLTAEREPHHVELLTATLLNGLECLRETLLYSLERDQAIRKTQYFGAVEHRRPGPRAGMEGRSGRPAWSRTPCAARATRDCYGRRSARGRSGCGRRACA